MYTAIVIALIVGGLAILLIRSKNEQQKQQNIVENYVTDIFSTETYRPEVSAGYTYGIPSFTLKFKTDKEKQHAVSNGLTKQFENKIQELCGHLTPRDEKFDAQRAVSIYSEEDEERWKKDAAAYRSEQRK